MKKRLAGSLGKGQTPTINNNIETVMHKMTKRKIRKNTYQKRTRNKQKSSPIAWLFGGIFIGILISSFFYFKSHHTKTRIKRVPEEKLLEAKNVAPKREYSKHQNPQYDFYDLLSKHEDSDENEKNNIEPHQFLIEVAEFKNFSQADQLKAQLSLIGVDNIKIKKFFNKQHLAYKVVSGPFNSQEVAALIQQRLSEYGIKTKIKNSNSP